MVDIRWTQASLRYIKLLYYRDILSRRWFGSLLAVSLLCDRVIFRVFIIAEIIDVYLSPNARADAFVRDRIKNSA